MRWFRIVLGAVQAAVVGLAGMAANTPVHAGANLVADGGQSVEIRLEQAWFDPVNESPALPVQLRSPAGRGIDDYFLVQFDGPVRKEWRDSLVEQGIKVLDYVPDFAFVVKMDENAVNDARSLEHVRWVGPFEPAFRVSQELIDAGVLNAAPSEPPITLVVRGFAGESRDTLQSSLLRDQVTIEEHAEDSGGGAMFRLSASPSVISDLAKVPGVARIERFVEDELFNAVARSATILGKDAVEDSLGLYGEGQAIGIVDSGLSTGNVDTVHADFAGRVLGGTGGLGSCATWSDTHYHGTHVAGSALGSGVRSGADVENQHYAGSNAGIAPEALVYAWGGCGNLQLPLDIYVMYRNIHDFDDRLRISNNSWGSSLATMNGAYNANSRNADRMVWDFPEMVLVMAAGNSGVDANANGIIDLGSIRPPATGKNVIAVGASENLRLTGGYNPGGPCSTWGGCWPSSFSADPIRSDRLSDQPGGMVAFSGRGPTTSGRLKPDIVAPGSNIVSARSELGGTGWGVHDAHYLYAGGTSMAAPLVSGGSAIVREFYDTVHDIQASAALVKATLINGAFDMTPGQYGGGATQDVTRRPDNNQGWGRMDLPSSLLVRDGDPRELWFHENEGLQTDDTYSAELELGEGAAARFTLAWSDYPGLEASAGALVNDLDLRITGPGGTVYLGNQILGGTGADRANNIEGVDILAPEAGTYTVTVTGFNVPQGPQPFALVVTGVLPTGGGGSDPLISVTPSSLSLSAAQGASTSSTLTVRNVGGGMLNWDLLDPVTLANARGAVLIDEDFEGAFPPAGWTTVDNSAAADCPWLRSDEYPLPLLDPALSRGAAIDSDDCGVSGMPANSIDTSLIAPTLDLGDATEATLTFDLAYRHWAPQRLDVDVSTNGGASWTTVHSTTTGPNSGTIGTTPQTVDLSDYAGESTVSIRWRFNSGWSWWAFVDNVLVTADAGGEPPGSCWTPGGAPWLSASPTSGSVAGSGNQAIALVANATGLAAGDYDTTLCVSSDDSAGNTPVEVPVTLTVTAGGGSDPVIAVAPTSLSFSVAAGGSDSDDLAISNIGGGTLDWSIATAEGTRVKPLNLSRAARAAQAVQGVDLRFTGTTSAAPAETRIRDVAVRGGDPISVRVVTPDASTPANLIADLNAFPDIEASLHTGALASLTVNDLLPFDVVAINNNNRWSTVAGNDVRVGNVLADYVDAGGKVVVFNYAYDNVGWGLAGRFVTEGYGPFLVATAEGSPSVTMNVVEAKHPIFAGVGAVTSTGLNQALPVNPNAQLLASWSNGWAMIAANADTVGFNLLYGPTVTWTGDVDVLVHNAIVWLADGETGGACRSPDEVSWLTVETASGSTAGGATDVSGISVSGAGLAAGSYEARLCVSSNDSAGNGLVLVPVTLDVAGGGSDPIVAVTPAALDFSVDSGGSDSDDLSIGNVGGGTLTWSIQTTETTRAPVDLSRSAQPAVAARSISAGARSGAAIAARPTEHRVRTIALRGGDPVSVLVVSPDGEISDPPDFPAPPQNLVDDLNAFPDTTATLYTGALASVTAAAFQAYDVVIVSNNGRWSTVGGQTSVGNALADYVDAGGKVVVFNFAYDFFGWELGGRFITQNYGPFQQATSDSTAAASMVVVQAAHPVFDGVKSVTMPDGFFRLDTALTSGAQLLANWSDGLPFVAANDNSVALNILYGANPSWTGDLDILVHNAVVLLADSGGPQPGACGAPTTVSWLSVGTASGSTAAGATSTSTITVDASGLAAGSYQAALCVASNDPVNPQVEVPVTLTVTGDPPITDRIFCDGFEEGGDGTCGSGPGPGDDIIVIDGIDFTPNADGTGGSIVWADGFTCQCDGFEPGDPANLNFNVYNAGVPFFYWPTGGGTPRGAVTLDGGSTYAVLASGAVIGPASTYMSPGGSATFTAPWHTPGNVDGYLGFQFLHGGITKYGYARISTGPNGRPFIIHSVRYNDAGNPITIP